MVVVGDEAVQRAVVLRLGVNFRATVCSDINAAVEMLLQRMKEFDFVVISEELIIGSSRPEIMKLLREETGLRLLVLRNEGGNEYSFVPIVRRSDTAAGGITSRWQQRLDGGGDSLVGKDDQREETSTARREGNWHAGTRRRRAIFPASAEEEEIHLDP
uniref:Uncharacterized protein n=1 Tax=Oryza glumipatula TaxID=40148 RepID=A0A0E0ATJ4_9ORYZ